MKPRKKSHPAAPGPGQPAAPSLDLDREHSFRRLAMLLPVGVFLHDAGGRTVFVNERWTELTGLTLEESQSENRRKVIHPDDRERAASAWASMIQGGEDFEIEFRLMRPDGDVCWMSGQARRLLDEQGCTMGFVGTLTDITKRYRAEHEAQSARAMLEATLDATTLAVVGFNLDGKVTLFNKGAERMLGYRADEMMGGGVDHILVRDEVEAQLRAEAERQGRDARDGYAIINDLVDGGRPYESFVTFVRKDGSRLPVHSVVTAIRDARGRQLGRLMVVRDLTTQRQYEGEMRRAREEAEAGIRARGEFLANVSHEVRTPLNGILGMVELLLGEVPPGPLLERLRVIQDSAESLLRIVNDVLDFSKIEAGKFVLDPAPFDLRAEVQRVTRAMNHRAQEKGLRLVCQIDPSLPAELVGDAGRLQQVLINLLGNAIKFTPSGAVVLRVQGEPPASPGTMGVRFEVIDTGIGIAADKQEAIFRPFEQVDTSTTRKAGGTGLGLPIGARLVGLMGGQLTVQSAPGEGSTFAFSLNLPLPSPQPPQPAPLTSPTPPRPEAQAEPPRGEPLRVLVVEDNAVNRLVAVAMLERLGHRVWVATSGAEALNALAHERFDVVLMDVQMPGMDGLQTTAAVRELESKLGRRTPIVALTAHAMAGHERACREAGMDAFLSKPIRAEALDATLRGVCSPRALVQQGALAARFGDDAELLSGAAALLRAELPGALDRMRAACARADGPALASAAHRIIGSVGMFEAAPLVEALRRVEALGHASDLASAAAAVEAIAPLFAQLERELQALTAP